MRDRPGPREELDEFTLARAQRGDPAAAESFVRCYERQVFALLGRMLSPRGLGGLVEDLAQETFVRALGALPRFQREGAARLSTWVLCIASRRAINELSRVRPPIEPLPEAPAEGPQGEGWVEQQEHRRAIAAAVAELSPEQQAVFVLREFHGLDDAAVAKALELEIGAVKSRMHRARQQLRRALDAHHRGTPVKETADVER
ncbi:MAG: sigma-70 family RNA polymerase sigma factor [Deltaproteobacteria bacterium]|nr:sigma-70 family RNA polymerase sigma factor [Deltaproteobacteria bacterium]